MVGVVITRKLKVGERVRLIGETAQVNKGSEGRVTMGLTANRSSVCFDKPAVPYAFWVFHEDLELVTPDAPDPIKLARIETARKCAEIAYKSTGNVAAAFEIEAYASELSKEGE